MASKSRSTKNPAGRKSAPVKTRAARSPEHAIADRANTRARKGSRPKFGAPVTSTQVRLYQLALKRAKLNKGSFVGSGRATMRQLDQVAMGDLDARALPTKTRDALSKLSTALDTEHSKAGVVNKTWPRKHCIVLAELFAATRKRTPRKPAATEQTAPETTPAS